MEALLVGLGLGLSGGLAPGPLHTLILTTSLQRGFAAGSRIAVAPLLTDAPIVALTVAVVGALPGGVVCGLTIAGGAFLVYLGVQTMREAADPMLAGAVTAAQDYRRGVVANLLNPHPWLFWVAVGAPTLVGFWRESAAAAVAFVVGFYLLLVGSKVAFAFAVARGAQMVSAPVQRRLIVAGGVILVGLGVFIAVRAI